MLNGNSKMKDLFANEEATKIIQKYIPLMDPKAPKMGMVMNMALKTVIAFPQTGCPKEDQAAMIAEIEALNLE